MSDRGCSHLDAIGAVTQPKIRECAECVKIGASWVHLRTCQTCGVTLCCDSSPNRHASKHAHATAHPVIASAQPGERWLYCYPDDAFTEYCSCVCGDRLYRCACSINFRICGAGIAPAWRAISRPFRNKVIVGIAVIRKRAARLGTSPVFAFARTN